MLAERYDLQVVVPDWIEQLLEKEQQYHQAFFGQTFDLTPMKKVLENYGQEKVREWNKLGLEVHFLPNFIFKKRTILPGWEVKPEDWYWDMKAEGEILVPNPVVPDQIMNLGGIVVLIDTRLKPKYQDGKQMWVNDKNFLGGIIKKLREEGKIEKYKPMTSRFNVSSRETEIIRLEAAKFLGLNPQQYRLETALEMNIIPQLFTDLPRAKDGTTDTSVWCYEFFDGDSDRLEGGSADCGGLADVDYDLIVSRCADRSFRFLGVLES
jgi:hypothetical protein